MGSVLANRRQLLAGGGALAVATVAMTRAVDAHAVDAQEIDVLQLAEGATVVLHDRRVPIAAATASRLAANGARIIALTDDPVRMWRSELGALLAARDTRLLGVTRWPDFLLVSGLAAESRRHVRYQRLDPASDSMVWLIC